MGKIIRRIVALLLTATAIALAVLPAGQADAASDRTDFEIDNNTLRKYVGSESEVTVPSFITKIGKEAFAGNTGLVKVTLPDGLREIDFSAFNNCINLQKVEIPQSVRTIGSGAFSGCQSLHTVSFPAKLNTLGSGVFAGCTALANVNIDSGNESFVCQDGVIYSKDYSTIYMYLPGRTRSVYDFPASVNRIGEYAFWGSDKLTDVNVSKGVKKIPEYAFSNCKSLNSVTLPEGTESIERFAFSDCDNLKYVYVPDTVGIIDSKAFTKSDKTIVRFETQSGGINDVPAEALTDETAGDNDENIGVSPDASEAVDDQNVNGTDNIDSVNATSDTDNSDEGEAAAGMYSGSYSGQSDWKSRIADRDFSNNISNGELGSGMIVGGTAMMLMSPSMPVKGFEIDEAEAEDNVATEGANTSYSPENFEVYNDVFIGYSGTDGNITLPSVSKVGNRSMYKAEGIDAVNIPEGTQEIGEFAFARSSVSSVALPEGLKKINYAAFYYCDNLKSINIPSSVETIELGAFDQSSWLNDWYSEGDGDYLVVGDGILLAYKGDGNNPDIPQDVKMIAPGCFKNNESISVVNIPKGVRKIGEEAFCGCTNLKMLTLPETLTDIEDRAFKDTALDAVSIPDSVENIGLGAFDTSDGKGLSTIILAGNDVPNVAYKDTAKRLSLGDIRTDALGQAESVIVSSSCDIESGTLFDPRYYGYHGLVFSVTNPDSRELLLRKVNLKPDEAGNIYVNAHVQIVSDDYVMSGVKDKAFDSYRIWNEWCDNKPLNVSVNGNSSEELSALTDQLSSDLLSDENVANEGITVNISGNDLKPENIGYASFPGESGRYVLNITQDGSLKDDVENAYFHSFGSNPSGPMIVFDMSMYDKTSTIPICKFGKNKLEVSLPCPPQFVGKEGLEVLSIDENGILSETSATIHEDNGNYLVDFIASHCSVYALYLKSSNQLINPSAESGLKPLVNNLDLNESMTYEIESVDNPVNLVGGNENSRINVLTDDRAGRISARWIVVFILLCTSVILVLYKPRDAKK